jgi:hypothetical protein
MSIRATSLTSGPVTTGYEEKPYKWRGDSRWNPGDKHYRNQTPEPDGGSSLHNLKSSASRRERLAEFASHLEQGRTVPEAAKLLKIALKTARTYARELNDQQRRENPS